MTAFAPLMRFLLSYDPHTVQPWLHDSGFLQVDLEPNHKLNVWSKDLPSTRYANTLIHDHHFGFTSFVLMGELVNTTLQLKARANDRGAYYLYSRDLVKVNDTAYDLSVVSLEKINPGSLYSFPPAVFHETHGFGLTATYIVKTSLLDTNHVSKVACLRDEEPDSFFDREQHSREDLMPVLNQVMSQLYSMFGRH